MKVYYALYDQSYDNNAQYWTWFPEEITQQMRDAIASKSGAFQMRPKHPNRLETPDVVGGIINFEDQWCVVYRFFNGGNDPQGRPDRCVLATAWVKTEEAQGQNLYDLLFCPVFQNVQKEALTQCPVPAPQKLVENYSNPVQQDDPQFDIYKANPDIENWSFKNPEETQVVGKLFPLLTEEGLQSLQVLQSSAYMETFSGTPLASGVTYVPKTAVQEEQETENNAADEAEYKRLLLYRALFQGLFLLFLMIAMAFTISHSTTCQKFFTTLRQYIQKQPQGNQTINHEPVIQAAPISAPADDDSDQ
ncbi:MAG: hypothetical protein IJG38_13220 [Thermoguttaceae bacterium]|nr:hypothetical protein [Thermoguttaceae bacterium]